MFDGLGVSIGWRGCFARVFPCQVHRGLEYVSANLSGEAGLGQGTQPDCGSTEAVNRGCPQAEQRPSAAEESEPRAETSHDGGRCGCCFQPRN